MGYVEELRALIGHRRVILNGCVTIVRDSQWRILMQKRVYPLGKWGLPGGLMELGESTEQTARREVLEETGLTLGKLTLIGVYSGEGYLCRAANGDEYDVVTTAYRAEEYSGELKVDPEESLAFEWRELHDLPDNIAGTHREILRDYISARRMRVSEVCLLTRDVVRMASFYKALLGVDNGSDDAVHQFIISRETTLTIYNDGESRPGNHNNIRVAFTVDDVDAEFARLTAMGVTITDPPTQRPWGAKNMTFLDPEGNRVTFRCFPKEKVNDGLLRPVFE